MIDNYEEGWQVGIVIRRIWQDSDGNAETKLLIRSRKENVLVEFGKLTGEEKEKWNRIHPGYLVAFRYPIPSKKPLTFGIEVLMESEKTGFIEIIKVNIDL